MWASCARSVASMRKGFYYGEPMSEREVLQLLRDGAQGGAQAAAARLPAHQGEGYQAPQAREVEAGCSGRRASASRCRARSSAERNYRRNGRCQWQEHRPAGTQACATAQDPVTPRCRAALQCRSRAACACMPMAMSRCPHRLHPSNGRTGPARWPMGRASHRRCRWPPSRIRIVPTLPSPSRMVEALTPRWRVKLLERCRHWRPRSQRMPTHIGNTSCHRQPRRHFGRREIPFQLLRPTSRHHLPSPRSSLTHRCLRSRRRCHPSPRRALPSGCSRRLHHRCRSSRRCHLRSPPASLALLACPPSRPGLPPKQIRQGNAWPPARSGSDALLLPTAALSPSRFPPGRNLVSLRW